MNETLKLIKKYQHYTQKGTDILKKEYECEDLLENWRLGLIPRAGELSNGLSYEFHGVGCFICLEGVSVDFDFGPKCRVDGFDLWRLSSFIEDNPLISKSIKINQATLKVQFNKLVKQNIIYKPNWFPGSSLYYFSDLT